MEEMRQDVDTAWTFGYPSVNISAECGRMLDAVAAKKGMRRHEIIGEAFSSAVHFDENALREALEQYLKKETVS